MGRALEVISGRAAHPDAVLTALTMAAGDTLTVRNAPIDSKILLLQLWADVQTAAGTLQVRSPKLHDNVRGLRYLIPISDVAPVLPMGVAQRLVAQDTLIAEISAAGDGAGDFQNVALLLYYENCPGTDARLMKWPEVLQRMTGQIVTVENTITTAAGGGWTGAEAINAEQDLLKANTDYALLGYVCTVECCAVGWRGADTGNLRVGGPGIETEREYTSDWFKRLSLEYDLPLIPIFNSANRAGILIDAVQDENAAAVGVQSIFAELSGSTVR